MSIIYTCVAFNWNERKEQGKQSAQQAWLALLMFLLPRSSKHCITGVPGVLIGRRCCISWCHPPCRFLMSKFSDQLSASLANIPIYNRTNVSKCARGSGLVTRHPVTCDITPWHGSLSNQRPVFRSRDLCCPITGQYSGGGKCHCPGCYGGMWPQSGPIVPPRPQVARQNILWEQRLRRDRGDLTVGGVLIKLLNELYWSTARGEMINWILYWRCSKESSLKWNYHLFQHELIMFSLTFAVCQQSQSPWTSCCDEKIVTVFCICISLSSVRDERRKKVVICPLCLVSSLVLFTFCWASYLFWTAL